MVTLEIKGEISKEKLKMVLNVLNTMGITAVINNTDDTIALSKDEFVEKIERARKSPKVKVIPSEQSKSLGI